jgi:hypothetical protein
VSCRLIAQHPRRIACHISFPAIAHDRSGDLLVSITRGTRVAAIGHGRLRDGAATVTMRELARLRAGTWTITLVLSHRHHGTRTLAVPLSVRHAL